MEARSVPRLSCLPLFFHTPPLFPSFACGRGSLPLPRIPFLKTRKRSAPRTCAKSSVQLRPAGRGSKGDSHACATAPALLVEAMAIPGAAPSEHAGAWSRANESERGGCARGDQRPSGKQDWPSGRRLSALPRYRERTLRSPVPTWLKEQQAGRRGRVEALKADRAKEEEARNDGPTALPLQGRPPLPVLFRRRPPA